METLKSLESEYIWGLIAIVVLALIVAIVSRINQKYSDEHDFFKKYEEAQDYAKKELKKRDKE